MGRSTADASSATLWQRLSGWSEGLRAKAADRLPVRIGGMEYRQTSATPARVLGFDQTLLWVVVALLAWGVVMVYSASIALPDNPRFGKIAPCDGFGDGLCGGFAHVPGAHENLGARGALAVHCLHFGPHRCVDSGCGHLGQWRAALAEFGADEFSAL